jgi:hypothetical protein
MMMAMGSKNVVGAKASVTTSRITLENSWVKRVLEEAGGVWCRRSFARVDGSDASRVESEEFQNILME